MLFMNDGMPPVAVTGRSQAVLLAMMLHMSVQFQQHGERSLGAAGTGVVRQAGRQLHTAQAKAHAPLKHCTASSTLDS